jgi:hypothetical protein
MTAIARSKTKIWIVPANTNPSQLVYTGSTDYAPILGEIKSYSKSGGENDVESDPVFGGYVDKEKPQSQFELSFDVVPQLESDRWITFAYTEKSNGVYIAGGNTSDKAVFIEASTVSGYSTSSSDYRKVFGFNNCLVTVLDQEHNADDNQTYTFNLKFSPTTSGNVSNVMTKATTCAALTAITAMPTWDTLTI